MREGRFDAIYLPERFQLPKQFSKRGSEETYAKDVKDMVFDATPAFESWFENVNNDLGARKRGGAVKPSLEAIESGAVDFRALADETRRKMEASFYKGQALGQSRARQTTKRKTTKRTRTST